MKNNCMLRLENLDVKTISGQCLKHLFTRQVTVNGVKLDSLKCEPLRIMTSKIVRNLSNPKFMT